MFAKQGCIWVVIGTAKGGKMCVVAWTVGRWLKTDASIWGGKMDSGSIYIKFSV